MVHMLACDNISGSYWAPHDCQTTVILRAFLSFSVTLCHNSYLIMHGTHHVVFSTCDPMIFDMQMVSCFAYCLLSPCYSWKALIVTEKKDTASY